MKLKHILSNKLEPEKLALIPSSFDVIGDILIFNSFPDKLKAEQKLIGNAAIKLLSNIKVVAIKSKKFSGRLRTQKLKIIAGEKRKTTQHKENGVRLNLDVEKCYFSPRSSTERLRIAKLIKPHETVLVAFSGVAPFPIVLAKNSRAKEIYGIELSKLAHKYALENLKLNKTKNVTLFQGDVKKILPEINKKFDRILLPLPKSSSNYLGLVKKYLKSSGIVHLYTFVEEEKVKDFKIPKFKVLKRTLCGHYSPRLYRVCFDISRVK